MSAWAEFTTRLSDVDPQTLRWAFWSAVILSLVVARLPSGRTVLYPLSLLATWAHELGHGVTAVLAGGSFYRLEVERDLGGRATYGGVGPLGRAAVAAGGLLAPAVAGGAIIVLGANEASAPWVLVGVIGAVAASLLLVVRNGFGWVALGLVGLSLMIVAAYAPPVIRIFVAQLIGIQFCLASWGSVDYMFSKHVPLGGGRRMDSDTQTIARALWFPYWFWGGLIAALSLAIVAGAYYLAWIRPLEL